MKTNIRQFIIEIINLYREKGSDILIEDIYLLDSEYQVGLSDVEIDNMIKNLKESIIIIDDTPDVGSIKDLIEGIDYPKIQEDNNDFFERIRHTSKKRKNKYERHEKYESL